MQNLLEKLWAKAAQAAERFGDSRETWLTLFFSHHCASLNRAGRGSNLSAFGERPSVVEEKKDDVLVWPVIGGKSKTMKAGGAFRLWIFAKKYSESGRVNKKSLRQQALSKGIPTANYYRWLQDAKKYGFIRDIKQRDYFLLRGPDDLADSIGLADKGKAVYMPMATLFGKSWRSEITAGTYATFPMASRRTMKKITKVSARTQSRHDKCAGVNARRNYKAIPTDKRYEELKKQARFHVIHPVKEGLQPIQILLN